MVRVFAASVLRNQNYADGVRLLLRYAAACDAANTPTSLCRAYLGAIVVQLYAENAAEAWQIYQVGHSPLSSACHIVHPWF